MCIFMYYKGNDCGGGVVLYLDCGSGSTHLHMIKAHRIIDTCCTSVKFFTFDLYCNLWGKVRLEYQDSLSVLPVATSV